MEQRTEGALQIISAILIVVAVIYFSNDIEKLTTYGYLGVFLIALLSTATIIFPSPGWAAVIAISPFLDPLMLGIAAGTGSAIGEMTGFMAGDGARAMLDDKIKEAKRIKEWVKRYDVLGIFVLAFLPNPLFDIAGIVAGGLKIPWYRFLISCALGRVLRYGLLAMLGAFTASMIL